MRALAFLALLALTGCDFVPTLSGNRSDVPQAGSGDATPTPDPSPTEVAAAPAPAPVLPANQATPAADGNAVQAASHDVPTVMPAGAAGPMPGAPPPPNATGFAPSFDCRGAMGQVETLICNDNRLAQLDRRLTRAYADARDGADAGTRADLLAGQRGFLARRDSCGNAGCVAGAYRERIADVERSAANGDDSCRAEIGDAAAARLVRQCFQASPATHPPCNAANSCAMIQGEIDRSCALFEEGDDIPGFCRR